VDNNSIASANRHPATVRSLRPLFSDWISLVVIALFSLLAPAVGFAESGTSARLDFRIVVPAIIRVTPVSQPDRIVINAQHIAQGYVDLDAGTAVRLTNNTHSGYQLTASYDDRLLSAVEVTVANQKLTTSSGPGSMRVLSGLAVDRLVAIGYRLHLAPGIVAGEYRWPVALAFSLVAA